MPESHPLSLGGAGLSPLADTHLVPFVREADLILLVGYDPIEMRPGWQEVWDPCETKVIDIVAEQMGADKTSISRSTHFVDDLNADSLDTVELVMEFEDEFDTDIPDEKAEQIKTVGEVIEFVMQARGAE